MVRAKFSQSDFLAAALAIAIDRGPSAVTVASISERLGAPTGSFYHRFASRNVLLGALWLRTVLNFSQGVSAALDAGDGLGAVLHTPAWSRENMDEARLLLLYHRNDFIQGQWPEELRHQVAAQTRGMAGGAARFASLVFGHDGADEVRRAQFLLSEIPVAAVRQHLLRGEPPPPMVDHLLSITYRALVADYRAHKRRSGRDASFAGDSLARSAFGTEDESEP